MLILSFSPISQDARVLKQVRHFSKKFLVTTCGYGSAPSGVHRHIEIDDELQVWRYNRLALIARQYRWAYWRNAAVSRARALLCGEPFDVVLANDVDAVPLALSLPARFGVHADLHEFAPRQKEELLRWRLFVAPFMRWLCRRFVTSASSATTVSEGLAREYGRAFDIHAGVVTNAAPYVELSPHATSRPIRFVHSGACLRDRNLMMMIDAASKARQAITLDFFLTANDPGYLRELSERAAATPGVTLNPPVPYDQLARTLNGFDVGVHVLPPVNFNNEWALPNKLFDYVQSRLGIIVGPSPEMSRYVSAYSLGEIAEDFSTEALTAVMDQLTPESVDAMKGNAHAAARELSADTQVLLWDQAIERLLLTGPEQ